MSRNKAFKKRYLKGEDPKVIEKFIKICESKGWLIESFGVEKLYSEKMTTSIIQITKTKNNVFARLERFRPDFSILKPNIGLFPYELKNTKSGTIEKECYEGYKEYHNLLTHKKYPTMQNDAFFIVFHIDSEFREVNFNDIILCQPWFKSELPESSGKLFAFVNWTKTKYTIL